MVSMSLMDSNPKVGWGHTGTTSSTPVPPVESCSPSEVQKIPADEATLRTPEERIRGASEVPGKRRAKDSTSQRKKGKGFGRHRFHHETDESKYRMSKAKDLLTLPKRHRLPNRN
ncbi:hypothetical protein BHM03_00048010 [Ensete ventricosum]|nr:hypothetical protein BHM03_00048010 [Ensete ventricosum]